MNEQKWLGQREDGELPAEYCIMAAMVVVVLLTILGLLTARNVL